MSAFKIPEMAQEEFCQWQSMLERKTGLWMPETRKVFLVTSLQRLMREKGISKYKDFYELLDQGVVSSLDWAKLVDSLTVHETCFYRDKDSINLVASFCRNKLRQHQGDPANLQLWSVGCSTGEEVYTLAIEMEKLNQHLKQSTGNNFYYGVTGVDVSYPSLAVAREGVYSERHSDFLPESVYKNYFEKLSDGHIRVNKSIRKRSCFMQTNILEPGQNSKQSYDVIYCQNVMIYFKKDRKEEVINHFENQLKPGGLLVLGHSEITQVENKNLTRVNSKKCLAFIKNKQEISKFSELS